MIEIEKPGLYTTVQDYPGRVGYWNVGVPPSGPMDALAFRLANRVVGNRGDEAGLEITLTGPVLRFRRAAVVCVSGLPLDVRLEGKKIPMWQAIDVKAGAKMSLERPTGAGCRAYVALAGGIDVPEYLGSRSTFPKGSFGGYKGRPLHKGDVLKVYPGASNVNALKIAEADIPRYSERWEIDAVPGPYAAPDYFTPDDEQMFFSAEWRVHRNSNRLGYRLEGPKPQFTRTDGGEGGRHPSNVHDYAYAIGTVNFTGDMPIVITVDGPSLGGFVSLATITTADLWKIGQARPHGTVRFRKVNIEEAVKRLRDQEAWLCTIS